MKIYCKAYYLSDLRQFAQWEENNTQSELGLSGDEVVYVWDDFTVVKSPVGADQSLLFDAVTPEWQDFCRTTLKFALPEDLQDTSKQVVERAQEAEASISV